MAAGAAAMAAAPACIATLRSSSSASPFSSAASSSSVSSSSSSSSAFRSTSLVSPLRRSAGKCSSCGGSSRTWVVMPTMSGSGEQHVVPPSSVSTASQVLAMNSLSLSLMQDARKGMDVRTKAAADGEVAVESSEEGVGPVGDSEGGEATLASLPRQSDIEKKLKKKVEKRRKRLKRKRAMRKKGRWPPSKMAKLKNV